MRYKEITEGETYYWDEEPVKVNSKSIDPEYGHVVHITRHAAKDRKQNGYASVSPSALSLTPNPVPTPPEASGNFEGFTPGKAKNMPTKFVYNQEVFFLTRIGFYICRVHSITIEDIRNPKPIYHLIGEDFDNPHVEESDITDDYEYACSLYR